MIVQTAVESAKSVKTVLVSDETDLLVLTSSALLSRRDKQLQFVFLSPTKQKSSRKKVWDKKTKAVLGFETCSMFFLLTLFYRL